MLSQADNELLTRVGPGTPMGNLMRQYWMPAMLVRRAAVAGLPAGAPAAAGREPHRLPHDVRRSRHHRRTPARTAAPRCSSAATRKKACAASTTAGSSTSTGACVDMPSEPAESNFKNKVRTTRLPVHERSGVVWVLHGPARGAAAAARARGQRWSTAQRRRTLTLMEATGCRPSRATSTRCTWASCTSAPSRPKTSIPGSYDYYTVKDRTPQYAVMETEVGTTYGAYRPAEEDTTTGASPTSCSRSTR